MTDRTHLWETNHPYYFRCWTDTPYEEYPTLEAAQAAAQSHADAAHWGNTNLSGILKE